MSKFYNLFPKTRYNYDGNSYNNTKVMTNILFRIKIIDKIKNNVYTYYDVNVTDEDTMEILADKYYGNPEYHWIIALANDIIDPQYDWPLTSRVFTSYIKNKYGTIANAQTQIHHYEKRIVRTTLNGVYDDVIQIDADTFESIPEYSYEALSLSDNTTVEEVITTKSVTCYEYERDANEAKRKIKLIKKDYLNQILNEFKDIMEEQNPNLRVGLKRIG